MIDHVEAALAYYKSRFKGRTYTTGQEPGHDEVLVAAVERLRQTLDTLTKAGVGDHKNWRAAVQRAEAAEAVVAAIGGYEKIWNLYERVHTELEDGKPWAEIDRGLRDESQYQAYEGWFAYMQQSMVNGLHHLILRKAMHDKAHLDTAAQSAMERNIENQKIPIDKWAAELAPSLVEAEEETSEAKDFEDRREDPNVTSVREKMKARAEFGLSKYGQVTRGNYTGLEMFNHLQEEMMDATVYLEELIQLENPNG